MSGSHESPPKELDRPLEIGPRDWGYRDFYHLVTGMVIPRPIGWISTISASGTVNLAPYSYFNVMGSDPFYVVFASTGVKDTLRNLREVPQFVANIVSMRQLEEMNFTSTEVPRDRSEFEWAGLTRTPAARVRPPRVAEAPAHLECEVMQIVDDHNTHIVLGRLVHAHVDPSVWRDGRVDPRLLDPVCRLSGSAYASLGELITLQRPAAWEEIKDTREQEAMPRAKAR